jgi:hypothetical protein
MNNLRDSIYKKSISNLESKSFFTKLKNKLVSLVNETENLNKNLLILGANIKENLEKENEENKKKETIEITKPTNLNNNLNKSEKNTNNIYNNITLNNNSNYDIEKIIAENKNLKAQIASQILLRSPKNEKEKNNENEILFLKNQIKKLEIQINEKENQINVIKDNLLNESFLNLKEDYKKNLSLIQKNYEDIIQEKENENNILNDYNNEYEKEVLELRKNLLKITNENRTKNILIEARINNLENEKKNLEIQINNLNIINNNNNKYIKYNNNIIYKNNNVNNNSENVIFDLRRNKSEIKKRDYSNKKDLIRNKSFNFKSEEDKVSSSFNFNHFPYQEIQLLDNDIFSNEKQEKINKREHYSEVNSRKNTKNKTNSNTNKNDIDVLISFYKKNKLIQRNISNDSTKNNTNK